MYASWQREHILHLVYSFNACRDGILVGQYDLHFKDYFRYKYYISCEKSDCYEWLEEHWRCGPTDRILHHTGWFLTFHYLLSRALNYMERFTSRNLFLQMCINIVRTSGQSNTLKLIACGQDRFGFYLKNIDCCQLQSSL